MAGPGQHSTTTQDRWQTSQIVFNGGIIGNVDELTLAHTKPGALVQGINFESGLSGGYRRVSGFTQFEDAAVTGTGAVLGVGVLTDNGIIAARNSNLYYSPGSGGWTKINTDMRSTPVKVRFSRYNFGSEKIIITDGTNYPVTYDGSVYTVLNAAPLGATCALAFSNYMFFGLGNQLVFSAPDDETDYNAADGAGVINVGFIIVGIRSWRGTLYVFGTNHIFSLTGGIFGGATLNAQLSSVTTNVGCVAPDSIQEISGDVLYLSQDGIRTISGTTRIGDIELGAITDPVHTQFTDFINAYSNSNFSSCVVRQKNQYRVFAANTGTNPSAAVGWNVCIRNTSLSYVGVVNNWEFFQLKGINVSCADSGYINLAEFVVHGSYDGFVYRQEQDITFNGAAISATLRLPYNGFDDPEIRKTFYKLKVNLVAEGPANLFFQMSYNFGQTNVAQPSSYMLAPSLGSFSMYDVSLYGTGIYGGTPLYDILTGTIGSGNNMALLFSSSSASDSPYTIRSVVLDYQLNGRR